MFWIGRSSVVSTKIFPWRGADEWPCHWIVENIWPQKCWKLCWNLAPKCWIPEVWSMDPNGLFLYTDEICGDLNSDLSGGYTKLEMSDRCPDLSGFHIVVSWIMPLKGPWALPGSYQSCFWLALCLMFLSLVVKHGNLEKKHVYVEIVDVYSCLRFMRNGSLASRKWGNTSMRELQGLMFVFYSWLGRRVQEVDVPFQWRFHEQISWNSNECLKPGQKTHLLQHLVFWNIIGYI